METASILGRQNRDFRTFMGSQSHEKNILVGGRGGRVFWPWSESSYWHKMLFWVWRHALCVGAAGVSPVIFVPFSLRPQSPGCPRLNPRSFPKAAPLPSIPFWPTQLWFAFRLSPQHHPFLILLPHPALSNQSPSFINSASLISLASNYFTPFLLPLPRFRVSRLYPSSVQTELL